MAALRQGSCAGNLTDNVDAYTLGLQETFTLTLRYDDQISAQPDYRQAVQFLSPPAKRCPG